MVCIVGGVDQPGVVVYDARLLPEIDQRQRVALEHAGGEITVSALIIEFDNVGNRDTTALTFERVREALLLLFGSPSLTHERGAFTVNVANDVNSDQLMRIMEWSRPASVIRFGTRAASTVRCAWRCSTRRASRHPPRPRGASRRCAEAAPPRRNQKVPASAAMPSPTANRPKDSRVTTAISTTVADLPPPWPPP